MKKTIVTLKPLSSTAKVVYVLEQVFAHLLVPFLMLLMLLRSRKEPAHLQNLSHRIGFGAAEQNGAVWIYAASLGETRAASPLIRRLRVAGFNVLLTHQSAAGLTEGARLFGKDSGIQQCYIPLDLFWAVRIFLRRFQPAALVVMEIEVWPAMLIETARKGIPIVMANGNLLEQSIGNGHGLRRHILTLYQLFSHIFTRTNDYRDRYLRIGVDPTCLSVVGDMKFDQLIDPTHLQMAEKVRSNLHGAERVLLIASSVEPEEALLVPMVVRLLSKDLGLRVIWAPRSPQRFQSVSDSLSSMGVRVTLRSTLGLEMSAPMPRTQVLVGDSTGEMDAYYSVADLVFVGASLVDHGGHNIIEPMMQGRPVVMGPSTYGIDFAAVPAGRAGAFESLPNAVSLEARIMELFSDPRALDRMGAAATRFTTDKTGAADKTFLGLLPLLGPTTKVVRE